MILTNKNLLVALVGVVLAIAVPAAQADDDAERGWSAFSRERAESTAVGNAKAIKPKWVAECSTCHIAFPPRFLPAESWREMMSGLDKHFGSDASLDAESAAEITAFLEANARRKGREPMGKTTLRITETGWFKREHDEISSRQWKNPKVKSPANCTACHIEAERGDFSEHNVNIPG